MPQQIEKYDFLIIGGGLFGCYTALYLNEKGLRVCLLEKEKRLFTKASIVNQARLHGGYHYPRSIATAIMSDENKARFTKDHKDFINFSFDKYYAIDRFGSLTDAAQFQRFCDFINIKCEVVKHHPYISMNRLEALFLTQEYSFDPILISNYYSNKIEQAEWVDIKKYTIPKKADIHNDHWEVVYEDLGEQKEYVLQATQVINATYAASNVVNQLFGMPSLELMHEISEMVLVHAPEIGELGLTVMDGQFASLMPYGKTGLLSLSSVAYTHHAASYESQASFACQQENPKCRPSFLEDCNYCPAQPASNRMKMLQQIKQYFKQDVDFNYFTSMYTIKSKLQANYIDDGRPTEIRLMQSEPCYYCIFAGKINSIYEIEKVLEL